MKKKNKKKSILIKIILFVLVIAVILVVLLGVMNARQPGSTPVTLFTPPPPTDEAAVWLDRARPAYTAESRAGQLLAEAMNSVWSVKLEEPVVSGESAVQEAVVTVLNTERFTADLWVEMQTMLEERVAQAQRRREVYDENGAFLQALAEEAFCQALELRLQNCKSFTEEKRLSVSLRYEENAWIVEEGALPLPETLPDALVTELLQSCLPQLQAVPLHYAIPEDVTTVPAPPEENFHHSSDPQEIAALLDCDEARALIGDRSLLWNPELNFLENSQIHLYLDETLLVLVWQEVEGLPVGTFSEVIIADGSQLRRKIAGDRFGSDQLRTTGQFAADCNAVLTLGGDYYWHPQRACGITVLDGQIARFLPQNADSCFITRDGDMLLVYRTQYTDNQREEVQAFVDENDVKFSLAFGPVLIDDGQDVTPSWYRWGEINDTYARSALGMLGDKHYLTVNLNCTDAHYYLATLQDATNALLKRGCIKAYTLDGGQTATTVFGTELINPVQFGWQKQISDVIYFASALR